LALARLPGARVRVARSNDLCHIWRAAVRPQQKTTVYLDVHEYRRLQAIARNRGVKTAALVREAVSQYARGEGEKLPATLGTVKFDVSDLSERADEQLAGFGDDDHAPRKPWRRRA
jgi:hypothetical protein